MTGTSFLLLGCGFRARTLLDVAMRLPGLHCVGVVVRSPRTLAAPFAGLPVFDRIEAALEQTRPELVVTATPRTVTAEHIVAVAAAGVPVLAETPPATDLPALRSLWAAVGATGLVQVAEQYLLMPSHAARAAVVAAGTIGRPTHVQVSSTQQYHAVSLIRGLLGVGRTPVTVRADRLTAPLVSPLDRGGWTDDPDPQDTTTTIATLDLGAQTSGLYDFTDGQTRNQLRFRRLLVRGTAGELDHDEVVRMVGPQALAHTPLVRRQTGHDLDLHGFDTEIISFGSDVVYRNPYPGQRWNDDEVATAAMLDRTAAWVRGEGAAPYPLADGIHDHQVALAIEEAATTGARVTTSVEDWTEPTVTG